MSYETREDIILEAARQYRHELNFEDGRIFAKHKKQLEAELGPLSDDEWDMFDG